jgi:hypothetical protein
MSWLYLPEWGGDSSQQNGYSDGGRYVTSNGINTASQSSERASRMDCSTMRQSGQISEVLQNATINADGSFVHWGRYATIWSLRLVSRVNHSAQRERDWPNMMSGICGRRPFVLLERSDRDGPYWRTSQICFQVLTGIMDRFCKTWPRAGTMRDGIVYRHRPLAPITRGTGSLLSRGMWPTPTMGDAKGRRTSKGSKKTYSAGPTLLEAVWGDRPGGKLNPDWVEWLMGWPIGWTALEPLGMDRFQEWLQAFGIFSHR